MLYTGLWTTFVDSGRARLAPMSMTVTRFLAEEDHKAAGHPISHKQAEKIGVW